MVTKMSFSPHFFSKDIELDQLRQIFSSVALRPGEEKPKYTHIVSEGEGRNIPLCRGTIEAYTKNPNKFLGKRQKEFRLFVNHNKLFLMYYAFSWNSSFSFSCLFLVCNAMERKVYLEGFFHGVVELLRKNLSSIHFFSFGMNFKFEPPSESGGQVHFS